MPRLFFSLALVTLSLIAPACATTFVWPSTQCNTTLQACINMAVVGDDVQVAQLADVDENLTVTRNISLIGRPRLTLAAGRTLAVTLGASVTTSEFTTISGVRFKRGRIDVRHEGFGPNLCSVTLRDVQADAILPGTNAYFINAVQAGNAPFEVLVSKAFLDLDVSALGSTPTGAVSGSKTEIGEMFVGVQDSTFRFRRAAANANILLIGLNSPSGDSALEAYANVLQGSGSGTGISASSAAGGSHNVRVFHNAIDRFATGIVIGTVGFQTLRIDHNTITRTSSLGIAHFSNALLRIYHNIFANGRCALASNSPSLLFESNLVFANSDPTSNCQLLGSTGLLTADPRFVNLAGGDTRLRPDSPARDVDTLINRFVHDADGQLRSLDAGGDLGAFETNDDAFSVKSALGVVNGNYLTPPAASYSAPSAAGDALFASAASTTTAPLWPTQGNLGVFFEASGPAPTWSVFNQNPASVLAFQGRFHVLSHRSGGNSRLVFANQLFGELVINDPAFNGDANAKLIVTPNWNAMGSPGIYDDRALAVRYDTALAKWVLYRLDGTLLPLGGYYNVFIAGKHETSKTFAPGPVQAPLATAGLRLDMPLLNDNPCAAPIATRIPSGFTDSNQPVLLRYIQELNGGYWYAVNANGNLNAIAVNVYFDGAQAKRCLLEVNEIFANGFED
jgi:hypothetical protein